MSWHSKKIIKVVKHYADFSVIHEVNGKSACNSFRGGRSNHKGEITSNLFFHVQVNLVDCPKCMETEIYKKKLAEWVAKRMK